MKKIIYTFLIVLSLPVLLSAQQPTIPLAIPRAVVGVTLDGVANEPVWNALTAHPINVIYDGETFSGAADLTASFKIFYNDSALILFIDVIDDIVIQADAHWVGDKVEIYIGGLNENYDQFDGALGQGARQFAVKAMTEKTSADHDGSWEQYPGQDDITTNGIHYMYRETQDGYSLELSINKTIALEDIDFLTIGELDFDISVADNDELDPAAGIRNRKSWYNDGTDGEAWGKMSVTGKITFGDCISEELCKPVGIYNTNDSRIKIYPNPAQNVLNVESTEGTIVTIYNFVGVEVLSSVNEKYIDVTSLKSGMYLVKATDKQGKDLGTSKLMKL